MKKITCFIALFSLIGFYSYGQDTCDTAIAITAGVYTVDAVNGSEVPDPICAPNGTGATAGEWYAYTPSDNYYVTVTSDLPQNVTDTDGDDTRVHIYNGDCSSLSCVAGDDDSGVLINPNNQSYLSVVEFQAVAGTTYYIAFDNKWDSGGFDFELIESDPPPPPVFSFTQQSVATSGSYGKAVADMNGDYLDDIITVSADNINIQLQSGSGTFVPLNIPTETAEFLPTWSMAIGDFNADGFNDLLYGYWGGVTFMRSNGDMTFTKISYADANVASQRSNFVDINNDGHLDAFVCHDVAPSVYYINDGNGNLTFYQSSTAGAPYELANYYSGGNYGSIWIDYDNDRNIDMFIAKCGGSYPRYVNQMHHNTGTTYVENAAEIGLADSDQTWSSAWGDFDNDGDLDVFIGASSGPHVLKMNNGPDSNYSFTDITAASGIAAMTGLDLTHENAAIDFDNDGYLDIVTEDNILKNNGDMTFTLFANVFSGTGCYGDFNNDGFVDARRGSNLYINDGNSNNWITLTTVGTDSNINGIGARVELYSAMGKQIRDVRSGEGFAFMSTLNTHFGIGEDTAIDNIVIYWPSGTIDNIVNPAINQHLVVVEGSTLSVDDETLEGIVIHPNPVENVINIDSPISLIGKIATIFDINGKKVLNTKLSNNELDVTSLGGGMYLLRIEERGKSITRKFIKK